MIRFFLLLILLFTVCSTAAQNVEQHKEVYNFDPPKEEATNKRGVFLIRFLDRYPLMVGKRSTDTEEQVLLWDLISGSSKVIFQRRKPDNGSLSVERMMITRDESKIIIYVTYSPESKILKTNFWGESVYSQDKVTFALYCYSILEDTIVWQTEQLDRPKHIPEDSGHLGLSHDNKCIYMMDNESIVKFSLDKGQIVNSTDPLFPKSLNLQINTNQFCFSPSGRYIAYFHEAMVMNFNSHIGTNIKVWDDVEKKLSKVYVFGRGVRRISFSPDEESLLTITNTGSFRAISLSDKRVKKLWKFNKYLFGKVENNFPISRGTQQFLLLNNNLWHYPQMVQVFKSDRCSIILSREGKLYAISPEGYLYLISTEDWTITKKIKL